MRIAAGTPLAEHVYVLDVVEGRPHDRVRGARRDPSSRLSRASPTSRRSTARVDAASRSELVAHVARDRRASARARAAVGSRRELRSAGRGSPRLAPPSRYRYGGTTLSGVGTRRRGSRPDTRASASSSACAPGLTTLTRTAVFSSSSVKTSARFSMPPFATEYAPQYARPRRPTLLVVNTSDASAELRSSGSKQRVRMNGAVRSTSNTRCHRPMS